MLQSPVEPLMPKVLLYGPANPLERHVLKELRFVLLCLHAPLINFDVDFNFLSKIIYISLILQTLGIYHSQNIVIRNLRSLNSQMFHILLYACTNAKLQGVSVSAPRLSPNTDGIHLSSSTGVTILNSKISTGDDCISIGPGSSNVWIEKVVCGPGHGIRYMSTF